MRAYIIKEHVGNDTWYHAQPICRHDNVDNSLMLSTPDIDEAEIWFFVDDANFVCNKIKKYHPSINPHVVEINLRIEDISELES